MGAELSLSVANDRAELPRLGREARSFLEQRRLPPETVYAVDLAIEELVLNVIKYAYPTPGRREIAVRLDVERSAVRLAIEDDGRPFDPRTVPEPELGGPLAERRESGLGLHLVRS